MGLGLGRVSQQLCINCSAVGTQGLVHIPRWLEGPSAELGRPAAYSVGLPEASKRPILYSQATSCFDVKTGSVLSSTKWGFY